MPNYFYLDVNGQKQGPVNDQQLQALATRGIITPDTPLATDTGHEGKAGQIPGLKFNAVATSPFAQTSQTTRQIGRAYSKADDIVLFDFTFRDVRLPKAIRRVCFAMNLCAWIFGVLLGLWCTGTLLGDTASPGHAFNIFFIVVIPIWFVILLFIFLVRIFCEWQIVMMDWIIATKNYVENTREQKK